MCPLQSHIPQGDLSTRLTIGPSRNVHGGYTLKQSTVIVPELQPDPAAWNSSWLNFSANRIKKTQIWNTGIEAEFGSIEIAIQKYVNHNLNLLHCQIILICHLTYCPSSIPPARNARHIFCRATLAGILTCGFSVGKLAAEQNMVDHIICFIFLLVMNWGITSHSTRFGCFTSCFVLVRNVASFLHTIRTNVNSAMCRHWLVWK